MVTGSHTLGGFEMYPGWRQIDNGMWINQAAVDRAMANLPYYTLYSNTVDRLQAEDRAVRNAASASKGADTNGSTSEPEIVVSHKGMTVAEKAAYDRKHGDGVSSIAAGGIASRLYDPSANWTATFNDIGNKPGLPTYLRKNDLIGSPEKNISFMNSVKDHDGVWQIDNVILPSLAQHLDDPDVHAVYDGLRIYVDDINSRANAETNRWATEVILVGVVAPAV